MNQLYLLSQLDPLQAVRDNLRASHAETTIAVAGTGLTAWLGQVNWAAVLAVAALAATTVGGTALQLWKQWRLVKLEIEARERELAKDE